MSAAPRVSVCVPTRDHAPYLEAAVRSALAQDADLEVLVHDDASTDDTAGVLQRLGDEPRVRVLRHARRVGVAANRASCLAAARGAYVAWLDADDELLPGALARQAAVLDADARIALVHGGHEVVDGEGRSLASWAAPFDADAVEPSAVAFGHLVAANELATSTVVARRDRLVQAGRYPEGLGASSTDWHLWLRVALRGAVAYTAAPAARYRQHAATVTRATRVGGERLRCDVRVVHDVLRTQRERLPDPVSTGRQARAALAAKALLHAGDAFTRGGVDEALEAVLLGGRLSPRTPVRDLAAATACGDAAACSRLTKAALRHLAHLLDGTRFGARLAGIGAPDDAWDAHLARVGRTVAARTTPQAVVAVIAKWDPAVLQTAGRDGCNFPDRALLPHGYPRDGHEAVVHLDELRRSRGVTHLVVPEVAGWWLSHYVELGDRLGTPAHADADCRLFDLGPAR